MSVRQSILLTNQRKQLMDELVSFNEKRGKEQFSDSENKRFNEIAKELSALDVKLEEAKATEAEQDKRAGLMAGGVYEDQKLLQGFSFARAMQDQIGGKGDAVVRIPGTNRRTLNSTNSAVLISEKHDESGAIFAPLAGSVLEKMGIEVIDVENEGTKVAKVDFDSVSSIAPYTEAQNVNVGTMNLVAVNTNLTNRGIILKVKNNLLRGVLTSRTENIIRRAIADKIQQELLFELLIGKANGFTGLDNFPDIQTVDAGGTALSSWGKVVSAYTKILDYNGETDRISAVIPPVVFEQMQNFKDTTNQYLAAPPGLKNMKVIPCSIIKKDYGAQTNKTRIYVGDFSGVKILMEGMYSLQSEHAYFEEDSTGFRIVVRADMQLHFPEHIVRVENVGV